MESTGFEQVEQNPSCFLISFRFDFVAQWAVLPGIQLVYIPCHSLRKIVDMDEFEIQDVWLVSNGTYC